MKLFLSLKLLEYRWTNTPHSQVLRSDNMINIFNEFERCLKNNIDVQDIPTTFQRQWKTIKELKEDIIKNGMRNPLICWKIPESDKYLVLVGNQRLCILKTLKEKYVPVWVVSKWEESNKLLQLYS